MFNMIELTNDRKTDKLSELIESGLNIKIIYHFPGYCEGFPDIFYNSVENLITSSEGRITPEMTIEEINLKCPGLHRFYVFR